MWHGYRVVAFATLVIGIAIDLSFFARFETRYSYTTPVTCSDILLIIQAFRVKDLLASGPVLIVITLSAVVTLVLTYVRDAPVWMRLLVTAPQLPFLVLMPVGLSGLLNDLPCPPDGEWFHEGWPFIEAMAVWLPIPMFVVVQAVVLQVRQSRLRRATMA